MLNGILSQIIRTDSYKTSQYLQYPEDVTFISSYIEARGPVGADTVFFGLQAFIKEYMLNPISAADIEFARKIIEAHGEPFNYDGWMHILKEHNGYLPIRIQAIPEGTVMKTGNVQVQVVNTDPECAWLVSYIETALLRAVWYPSTVASKSREMKRVISRGLALTSDIPVEDQINFKLHDFGARGATSSESATLGGMAHLVNFMGTDTIEGLVGAMWYYDAEMPGFSIPASEHSTMTINGPDGELGQFENMIEQFGGEGKIYACVSDSYDIWNACENLWPSLKDKIIAKGGTLVVRPDSGDPIETPIKVVQTLMNKFGYTTNSKGFKVLPPYIRVIQGDGITHETLPKLIDRLIEEGISIDNIAFGMGGGLLQKVDRDTYKYAMKASAARGGYGVWKDVYKDPIGGGKTSKRGRLGVIMRCGIGGCAGLHTVSEDTANRARNELVDVFIDGHLIKEYTFDEVRANAAIK